MPSQVWKTAFEPFVVLSKSVTQKSRRSPYPREIQGIIKNTSTYFRGVMADMKYLFQ